MFLLHILIPACNPSRLAFLMMCSAYGLNKQGDSTQLCHAPCSVLNQSVVPYRVLTVASRFHTYVLIYNICLSLSDLLHSV